MCYGRNLTRFQRILLSLSSLHINCRLKHEYAFKTNDNLFLFNQQIIKTKTCMRQMTGDDVSEILVVVFRD